MERLYPWEGSALKMEKAKNIATVAVFLAFVFGLAFWARSCRTPPFPGGTAEAGPKPEAHRRIGDERQVHDRAGEYLLDQFPRDGWRAVKAALRFGLFLQMDNNGVYLVGDSVLKLEYP